MRGSLYSKDINAFLKALRNLGWREVTPNERLHQREFVKGSLHLVIKKRKLGPYCLIHKDRIALGHHIKPITKGEELTEAYKEIIKEYKKIRR